MFLKTEHTGAPRNTVVAISELTRSLISFRCSTLFNKHNSDAEDFDKTVRMTRLISK